ncbi:Chitin deacetylase [Leucoagaricus sp. SymC.cos]|nr:Chitin deacetylase [Leucoagaricus sp. SymC.cos]
MLTNFLVTLAVSALVVGAPSGKQALAKLYTSCTVPNTVALTFDDGPWIFARNVSDALTKAGVKGTFFYNGNNYDCIYNQARVDDIKYVYAQGHQIGSHTWSHAHLTQLSKEEVLSEMQRVDQALQRILGVLPAFFRPPYGEYNDDVLTVAEQVGESAVNWDLDSGDSETKPVDYQKGVYDDAVKRHPSTILSLEHETYVTSRDSNEVVEYAISKLQGAGYKLVTVAECLGGLNPYRSTSAPESRTVSWSIQTLTPLRG